MADKLSESTWTAFAKKRDLDDAALVKALKAFDKTDEAKPQPRIDALADVVAQVRKLVVALPRRKPPLSDKDAKDAKDRLHALLGVAEDLQRDAQAALAAAASDDDDEADAPALLTTKMVPLLRELKKGDARMHALICVAGRATAVLIMRRAISPSRRKLLAEAVDAKGGMKYIAGDVGYEDKALTFVVQSQAGGLAKKLRQALLDQVGLRHRVRVRGDDGEEADGEDGDEATGADGDGAPAPPAAAPDVPDGGADAPQPPSAAALAYAQRLRKTRPALEQALRDGHPEAGKLRAVSGFAGEKAAAGDHAGATKALEMIEKLLAAARPGSGAPSAPGAGPTDAPGAGQPPPAAAADRGIVPPAVYAQTGLVWVSARRRIGAELQKLEAAIVDVYRDASVSAEIGRSVRKLDRVLEMFDAQVADSLEAAAKSTDLAETRRLHGQARTAIARYQSYLAGDALVQELDDNPFVPVAVKATLTATLAALSSRLT